MNVVENHSNAYCSSIFDHKMKWDANYWNERYDSGRTGWDIGHVATPLKMYIDQLRDKEVRILLPGAGNGYEAVYLIESGFSNVTVVDIARRPLDRIAAQCTGLSAPTLLEIDFFDHFGEYDLILEQTFFCALDPTLRKAYVSKMHELLAVGGRLVGVLFNIPLNHDRPPFGGNLETYLPLFETKFTIHTFEPCNNSIPPRQGSELFINCLKK